MMRILQGGGANTADWLSLRAALWPHDPAHATAIRIQLGSPHRYAAFLAYRDATAIGLAEVSLRQDYVNGAKTSPVAFLEGIFVTPAARAQGVARALIQAVEAWALSHRLTELASDTPLHNHAAQDLHTALGFAETERVVFYSKRLPRD